MTAAKTDNEIGHKGCIKSEDQRNRNNAGIKATKNIHLCLNQYKKIKENGDDYIHFYIGVG